MEFSHIKLYCRGEIHGEEALFSKFQTFLVFVTFLTFDLKKNESISK